MTISAAIRPTSTRRRGVSSVLSMMFLVIFGSLGAAMAVVAQGNLRTADSALKVSRAMSAAETGLVFAGRRLAAETSRFVVRRGVIAPAYADALWRGTLSTGEMAEVEVLPPVGYEVSSPPQGIGEALLDAHGADEGTVLLAPGDASLPALDPVTGQVTARPMRLGVAGRETHFRVSYRPIPGTSRVLVVSEGIDGDVTRTLQLEFEIDKQIEFALLSPNRIMIGKNVLVEGPLGTSYGLAEGDLNASHGHPLVMRSDFRYLDPALDAAIEALQSGIERRDADGDNRLRVHHPVEMLGVAGHDSLVDRDGDEYVDDFDLFLGHFDADQDGRVVWDPVRASAAGLGMLPPEFEGLDDQLARLLDEANEDRNGDGVVDEDDRRLGWSDGVIDRLDRVAKVRGRLIFRTTRDSWEAAAEVPWQRLVNGSVRSGSDAPSTFGLSESELRPVTTDMFASSAVWFAEVAQDDFASQVAAGVSGGGSFVPASEAPWEEVPRGSPNAYDWYRRPIYEDMTFRDVRIPAGTNAVFRNCLFEGVTYIETESACTDVHWNYAGAVEQLVQGELVTYALRYPSMVAVVPGEPAPVADTKTRSNNLRFDGCTFLGSIAGDTPAEYTHWRNKIQFTGPTRLYNRPDDPDLLAQPDGPLLAAALASLGEEALAELRKSSMMLPGWSVDVGNFANEQAEAPEDTPRIRMTGTIVAGVLDVRGTAEVRGTLLMTYRPQVGAGPLHFGGQADAFNTTIGYFGSLDGDYEGAVPGEDTFEGFGEISLRWDPDADLPDGIPWPVLVRPIPETYREARVDPDAFEE